MSTYAFFSKAAYPDIMCAIHRSRCTRSRSDRAQVPRVPVRERLQVRPPRTADAGLLTLCVRLLPPSLYFLLFVVMMVNATAAAGALRCVRVTHGLCGRSSSW